VDLGLPVDEYDKLTEAIREGNLAAFYEALPHADLKYVESNGGTQLLRAANWGRDEMVRALIPLSNLGACDADNCHAGHHAIRFGNLGCLRLILPLLKASMLDFELIEQALSNEDIGSFRYAMHYMPLVEKIAHRDKFVHQMKAEFILESNGRSEKNEIERPFLRTYYDEHTAFESMLNYSMREHAYSRLMQAATLGDLELVKKAMSQGESGDSIHCFGDTPTMAAARMGHAECFDILIQQYSPFKTDVNGMSAFDWAAECGNLACLQKIFEKFGAEAVAVDSVGDKALMTPSFLPLSQRRVAKALLHAIRSNRTSCISFLEGKLDSSIWDACVEAFDRATILRFGCTYGYRPFIKVPIEDVDAMTIFSDGQTPYRVALSYGHAEIASLFEPHLRPNILYGWNLSILEDRPYAQNEFFLALTGKCQDAALSLLKKNIIPIFDTKTMNVAIRKASSETLVCYVKAYNKYLAEMEKFCLRKGKKYGYNGNTPLMMAAQLGLIESVKAIIPYSDKYRTDIIGRTAEMIARKNGHTEVADFIISYCLAEIEQLEIQELLAIPTNDEEQNQGDGRSKGSRGSKRI
jgi:ankyrin repeat protein